MSGGEVASILLGLITRPTTSIHKRQFAHMRKRGTNIEGELTVALRYKLKTDWWWLESPSIILAKLISPLLNSIWYFLEIFWFSPFNKIMIILIKYSWFINFEEIFNWEKNNHPKLWISVSIRGKWVFWLRKKVFICQNPPSDHLIITIWKFSIKPY